MPRPQKDRKVHQPPIFTEFKPIGISGRALDEIILTIDEYEAFRLADFMGYSQEEAADEMEISRPTFTRLIESARKKIADMIVNGKRLRIEGGNVIFRHHLVKCASCGQMFTIGYNEVLEACPVCGSKHLINIGFGGRGHGRGNRFGWNKP